MSNKCHYCGKPGATYRRYSVFYHEICYERLRQQQREKYDRPSKKETNEQKAD